jgi:RNA polymerase sigma factor (TIGR02999 family)
MAVETRDFARLLNEFKLGDPQASGKLIALVYEDLHRLARAQMGYAPRDRTLNTTSLVHECYLRIMDPTANVDSKNHFFNLASKVMRQVLCDYARERLAEKRGGGAAHDTLSAVDTQLYAEATELVELDDLLNRLASDHPRFARVFECRYFAGLSEQETADALNVSLRTAQREWNQARQWLSEHMAA